MKKTRIRRVMPSGPRLVGYARVSTDDQNLDMQISALVNAGVHEENIHSEHRSAVAERRPKLMMALHDARQGDTFVVWKLDRLARDMTDLLGFMKHFEDHGIAFRSLTEGVDTSTPAGKLLFHVIGALAQFERDLVVERTNAGIAAHRARGGKIGQPKKIAGKKRERVIAMLKAGKKVVTIAAAVGVSPATIYNNFSADERQDLKNSKK
jgi:DNA invertase Pin-like site-specific DNA recombinase